ncbi:hypothetical protein ADK67_23120 [Saccharothrix sp. NRRL B-16348]|jgi:hypothetical protein|uniref:hypothetical protein n=1 Tax=Saccharothrix sp. NRRL B-16348 TaxID=1415542 RepID=UPI0006AF2719|nr:hypothetical protein [Saccharothrix sp. NRRL B-16348]KOX22584.1 hypothetical protein ADK67_23120 [Saccharothrix sp. NRRL B-16348]
MIRDGVGRPRVGRPTRFGSLDLEGAAVVIAARRAARLTALEERPVDNGPQALPIEPTVTDEPARRAAMAPAVHNTTKSRPHPDPRAAARPTAAANLITA